MRLCVCVCVRVRVCACVCAYTHAASVCVCTYVHAACACVCCGICGLGGIVADSPRYFHFVAWQQHKDVSKQSLKSAVGQSGETLTN